MFELMLVVIFVVTIAYFDFSEYETKVDRSTWKIYNKKVPITKRLLNSISFFIFWFILIWVIDYIVQFK